MATDEQALANAEKLGLKKPDAHDDVADKVRQVNELLKDSEPESVSKDTYSGYSGYKPQYLVDFMNKVFGIGKWGFQEVKTHTTTDEKGQLALAQVEAWIEGVEFRPVGWGQSRVTRGDVGDAKKGAQTDALKKALSYFSVGNRAYRGQL